MVKSVCCKGEIILTTYEIIAQAIGIVAMAFNVLSYVQKNAKGLICFQLFGTILFATNYFMLGATIGGIMNAIAVFRAIIYLFEKKTKATHTAWLIFFICIFITSYILTFTVFGKEPTPFNFLIELLPIIGMTAQTIGYKLQNAKIIRRLGFISSPCWLIYNITAGAVGAILCECFTICSIIVGIIKHDIKREEKAEEN